jgi:tetratricopeptide (TPR) repeat protein
VTRPMPVITWAILACGFGWGEVAAQEHPAHRPTTAGAGQVSGLGAVAFANSGAAAAQAPFLRGLAFLHSFEYEQAAESFRAASAADPGFAMTFWGEALTYCHLLWGEDDVAGARRALARLADSRDARLAKAGTPRERAFGEAIEALVAEGDLPARVRGFTDGMRRVAAAYPDDLDAASFAALASMFSAYVGRLAPAEQQAARDAAIDYAQRVFTTNPNHPGGAHYLIHACDEPSVAARGLEAARRYAQIAPDAEHALHMPSHIFVQLGLWPETVASNERSWAASQKEVAALKLTNADLSFHALLFEQYGHLQQGHLRASGDIIAKARRALAGVDLDRATHVDAGHAIQELSFQHAANADDWSADACRAIGPEPPMPPPGASDRARSFAIRARYQWTIAAVRCGSGDAVIEKLRSTVAALAAGDPGSAWLGLALRHAELLAYLEGRPPADRDALLADPNPPSFAPLGPPTTLRTEELLGRARLKAGRPRDAVAAYERALQLTPNRSQALLGLARARQAAGDMAGAGEAYRRLLDNWRHADADLPALAEVRSGAAGR